MPAARLSELSDEGLESKLASDGLVLDFGAARARIRSDAPRIAPALRTIYGAFLPEKSAGIVDVTVRVRRQRGLRRWIRPQVELVCDGRLLFQPFPADTHLPLLEWGMNFLLASRLSAHLLLHSGVVERGGRALILPAMPGSGKSTLTAALSLRGFRLLSDEFGVVRADGMLLPLLRPTGLKNASIDVIQAFEPRAIIGPRFAKTRKGTVAHLAPGADAVAARGIPATPVLIVFPRYDPAVEFELRPVPSARAFARLSRNSFNYEMLGPAGFRLVGQLVGSCRCFSLAYRDLNRAVDELSRLMSDA